MCSLPRTTHVHTTHFAASQNLLEKLPVTPFKLSPSTLDAPSVFEGIILVDGIRYQYGFSATSREIHDEWLFAFGSNTDVIAAIHS